jgi:hypothetical protein
MKSKSTIRVKNIPGITGKYNLDPVEHTYFTRDLSAKNCIEGACGSRALISQDQQPFFRYFLFNLPEK